MSKFSFTKKLELNSYKEGAYLEFQLLTFKDVKKISGLQITQDEKDPKKIEEAGNTAIDILKSQFVSGKLPSNNGLDSVTKEDLGDLPIPILTEAMNFLSQTPAQS